MSSIWTPAVDAILKQGLWLGRVGVQNWALNRHLTMEALSRLEYLGVAVLGGDVYIQQDDNIEQNYDSWYCEQPPGEIDSTFISRSIQAARQYVAAYAPERNDVMFAIVPDV